MLTKHSLSLSFSIAGLRMVQGPGETAEELRARHIRTNPPKNTDELGSAEDIEAEIQHLCLSQGL